jgi:hypothetical protein
VKLTWGVGKPVLFVKTTEQLPRIQAEITYTGTGHLKGRWELVKPWPPNGGGTLNARRLTQAPACVEMGEIRSLEAPMRTMQLGLKPFW